MASRCAAKRSWRSVRTERTVVNAIDVFAGAGGLSLGATHAGIDVALAIERDEHAAAAYEANHPGTEVLTADVSGLSSDDIKRVQQCDDGTVVFGGPPCQGFSYSNTRTRTTENTLNWLYKEFLRVIDAWQPICFVFENVRGITNFAKGAMLKTILRDFKHLGFKLVYGVLNAQDFGVPQDRSRFFLVGSRDGIDIDLPTPSGAEPPTVDDAIGDLPTLENGADTPTLPYGTTSPSHYARQLRGTLRQCTGHLVTNSNAIVVRRYRAVPPGGNWQDIPERLMLNYADRTRCHTGIYHRLQGHRPSIVIGNFRKNMLIHPHDDRGLSVREAARIQSFPDDYAFSGSIGFQQQQVGNAVPPKLAMAVFTQVAKAAGVSHGA